ncbi:MAG TPA: amidohydrolase family protein [Hyphomonas sp.]|nr:amidohydrolase [Hyphomonas sp.]HRJ01263.1 amidohydrolase family protein [Hyphomonas sp.]HRK66650.1 amidohydrolase family protein [Hyphomonas sp.]
MIQVRARRWMIAVAGAVVLGACAAKPVTAGGEDVQVFVNADVVTVDEAQPSAEAVAIREGRILAVGSAADVLQLAGPGAEVRDLGGRTLVPGFIDAHGHLAIMAQVAAMADLQPPPAGEVSSISELQAKLGEWRAAHPGALAVTGFGYDDSLLAEARHPDRHDLDAVAADVPVILLHTSAHFIACNSACLALAGINAETADPFGGVIRREADGVTPNGVLEETAMYLVLKHLPAPDQSMRIAGLAAAQTVYARAGITTVQDGATTPQQVEDMRKAASEGAFYLDIVAYQHFADGTSIGEDFTSSRAYDGHFRVGGIKLVLDGSPQGKTAWLTKPYVVPPQGQETGSSGYGTYSDENVEALLEEAHARGIQVIAHVNGDRAIDQLLEFEGAILATYQDQDVRTVAIHAQTAREDQLDRMVELGVVPSFFAAHPFFWGDWHRDQVLGPERAAKISPLASAKAKGLAYTMHTDSPVVPADFMRLIWVAVNRETRSGQVLGAAEKADPHDALRAVTLNAARQYFEEADKGSITPGKRADLVVLSANPLKVDPSTIKDIRVLETIKDGRTVFGAEE